MEFYFLLYLYLRFLICTLFYGILMVICLLIQCQVRFGGKTELATEWDSRYTVIFYRFDSCINLEYNDSGYLCHIHFQAHCKISNHFIQTLIYH